MESAAAPVPRVPGVRELLRLFPDPSSVGRGSIAVEGGITLVAGPGMGRTALLRQLVPALEQERGLPAALVTLPDPSPAGGDDGFRAFLAALVEQARAGLLASPLLGAPELAPLRAVLDEPAQEDGAGGGSSPRDLERWVTRLGGAASRTGGVCLLVDRVDVAAAMPWKIAFMAALRFAFQAATRVTPIYASWRLFLDESAPGSHYFRNVTRPLFLAPLAKEPPAPGEPSERDAFVERTLPGLSRAARDRAFALAGGHPQLLQRVLTDLGAALRATPADLDAAGLDAVLAGAPAAEQRALAARLISGSAELASALRELARGRDYPYRSLSKELVASGLVDRGARDEARVPELVRDVL